MSTATPLPLPPPPQRSAEGQGLHYNALGANQRRPATDLQGLAPKNPTSMRGSTTTRFPRNCHLLANLG
jgi:hypothetical protein